MFHVPMLAMQADYEVVGRVRPPGQPHKSPATSSSASGSPRPASNGTGSAGSRASSVSVSGGSGGVPSATAAASCAGAAASSTAAAAAPGVHESFAQEAARLANRAASQVQRTPSLPAGVTPAHHGH